MATFITQISKNGVTETYEMAQQVKVLAAEPDNPSSVPGTHTVEGKNGLLQVVLVLHMHP